MPMFGNQLYSYICLIEAEISIPNFFNQALYIDSRSDRIKFPIKQTKNNRYSDKLSFHQYFCVKKRTFEKISRAISPSIMLTISGSISSRKDTEDEASITVCSNSAACEAAGPLSLITLIISFK